MTPEELEALRQQAEAVLRGLGPAVNQFVQQPPTAHQIMQAEQPAPPPPSGPLFTPGPPNPIDVGQDVATTEYNDQAAQAEAIRQANAQGMSVDPSMAPPTPIPPGDHAPADPLAQFRPGAVDQGPQTSQWRPDPAHGGIVNTQTGEVIRAEPGAFDFVAQSTSRLGAQSASDAIFALQQYAQGQGAAGGGGGAGGADVTVQRDLMSSVDPRAAAQAALLQRARLMGEEEVRRANMQRFAASAIGQQTVADEQERAARERQLEHQASAKDAAQRLSNVDRVLEGLSNASIDPERFLNTGGNRIGAVLATALGSLGSLTGQPNQALGIIDAAIRRDIAAQQVALQSGHQTAGLMQRGLEQFRELTNDDQAARDSYRAAYLTALQNRVGALQTSASGVYADRLSRLATLLEQERAAALAAIPHRLGQVSVRMRHTSSEAANQLINPARAQNSAFAGQAPQGAQAAPGAAPAATQSVSTPAASGSLLEAPAQPGAIPQLNVRAATDQVMANLPGLGRVPADRDVADMSRTNPTRAAAEHTRRMRQPQQPAGRLAPLEGPDLARYQDAIAQQDTTTLPQFDALQLIPGREATARHALADTDLRRRLFDAEPTLNIIGDLYDTVQHFREAYNRNPGNVAGLLQTPEGGRVLGALLQLRQIRQISSGRGVLNEGDREVLDEEISADRPITPTILGRDWDRDLNNMTGLLGAWMRTITRQVRSLGYDVNSALGARIAGEAQGNRGNRGADVAVDRAAQDIAGTPPTRGPG